MKVIKKNVYYCDHCKKKGLVAVHIRHHEERCTNNPNRWCGACENVNTKEIVEALKARFTLADNPNTPHMDDPFDPEQNTDEKLVIWIGEPVTLKEIRDLADNCPACILAVLRQSGMNKHYFHLDGFDFKKEMAAYMSDKMRDHDYYAY